MNSKLPADFYTDYSDSSPLSPPKRQQNNLYLQSLGVSDSKGVSRESGGGGDLGNMNLNINLQNGSQKHGETPTFKHQQEIQTQRENIQGSQDKDHLMDKQDLNDLKKMRRFASEAKGIGLNSQQETKRVTNQFKMQMQRQRVMSEDQKSRKVQDIRPREMGGGQTGNTNSYLQQQFQANNYYLNSQSNLYHQELAYHQKNPNSTFGKETCLTEDNSPVKMEFYNEHQMRSIQLKSAIQNKLSVHPFQVAPQNQNANAVSGNNYIQNAIMMKNFVLQQQQQNSSLQNNNQSNITKNYFPIQNPQNKNSSQILPPLQQNNLISQNKVQMNNLMQPQNSKNLNNQKTQLGQTINNSQYQQQPNSIAYNNNQKFMNFNFAYNKATYKNNNQHNTGNNNYNNKVQNSLSAQKAPSSGEYSNRQNYIGIFQEEQLNNFQKQSQKSHLKSQSVLHGSESQNKIFLENGNQQIQENNHRQKTEPDDDFMSQSNPNLIQDMKNFSFNKKFFENNKIKASILSKNQPNYNKDNEFLDSFEENNNHPNKMRNIQNQNHQQNSDLTQPSINQTTIPEIANYEIKILNAIQRPNQALSNPNKIPNYKNYLQSNNQNNNK